MVGPRELDHEPICKLVRTAEPVEGQTDGQETAAIHDGLQVPECAGGAGKWKRAGTERNNATQRRAAYSHLRLSEQWKWSETRRRLLQRREQS